MHVCGINKIVSVNNVIKVNIVDALSLVSETESDLLAECTHTRNMTPVLSCSQCSYTDKDKQLENKDNKAEQRCNVKILIWHIMAYK